MADRIVFSEESIHGRRITVSVEGLIDETLLDAVQSFLDRTRWRLADQPEGAAGMTGGR
jgi:hypothetical protein